MDYSKLKTFSEDELTQVISDLFNSQDNDIFEYAHNVKQQYFQNRVYFRALIELTSFCKNDCYYCGLRSSNNKAERYRLDTNEVLNCCEQAYNSGIRTFVLQGGHDNFFDDLQLCELVSAVRNRFQQCAITLSFGERSRHWYEMLFQAGANRYLLRHETADSEHYLKLHPKNMSLENRKKCLYDLKEIGFQTGAGFMVGSPFQTPTTLAKDLSFLKQLQPHMVGIGPFIPQNDTPFAKYQSCSMRQCIVMIALARIILPSSLIPSTTAMSTIYSSGRISALKAGANVIMPNFSPMNVQDKYKIYNGKNQATKDIALKEHANYLSALCEELDKNGFIPDFSRGDAVLTLP